MHMYAALLQEQAYRRGQELLGTAPALVAVGGQPSPSSPSPGSPSPGRPLTDGSAPGSIGGSTKKKKRWGLLRGLLASKKKGGGRSVSPCMMGPDGGTDSPRSGGSPCSYACSSPRTSSPTASPGSASSPFLAGGSFSGGSPAAAAQDGEAGGGLAGVAALYRRAAGVYRHIGAQLLPGEAQAAGALPPAGDLPVELWPGMPEVLAQACLAQAQGVVAARAEARGSPLSLTAQLHVGAAGLYDAAAAALQAVQPPVPSAARRVSGGWMDAASGGVGLVGLPAAVPALVSAACP